MKRTALAGLAAICALALTAPVQAQPAADVAPTGGTTCSKSIFDRWPTAKGPLSCVLGDGGDAACLRAGGKVVVVGRQRTCSKPGTETGGGGKLFPCVFADKVLRKGAEVCLLPKDQDRACVAAGGKVVALKGEKACSFAKSPAS